LAAILIIEDDTIISNNIENCIYGMGRDNIRVLKAKEGMKALEITKMMEVNVFVINVELPDCDGVDLANEIRKIYPYQPIIIQSSNHDPFFQLQVHDQIENLAFLCKPYSDEKLITKIDHALNIAEDIGTSQLKINQNGILIVIEICNIIYIEKIKEKKIIDIVSYDQDKQCLSRVSVVGLSLSALLDMLEYKRDLFRCHRSFIINPRMIDRLNNVNNTISMKYTQEEIPIGKTFKRAVGML